MIHHSSPELSEHGPVDTINLIGWPCAGKGTATAYITEVMKERGIPFESFDLGLTIRKRMKADAEFSKLTKAYSAKGLLVPNEIVEPVILDGMQQLRQDAVWLLDGFPRTIEQVDLYRGAINKMNRNDLVVHLDMGNDPETEAKRRRSMRIEEHQAQGIPVREDDSNEAAFLQRLIEARKLEYVLPELKSTNRNITVNVLAAKETLRMHYRELTSDLVFSAMRAPQMSEVA